MVGSMFSFFIIPVSLLLSTQVYLAVRHINFILAAVIQFSCLLQIFQFLLIQVGRDLDSLLCTLGPVCSFINLG
jgi:hypothetical protein